MEHISAIILCEACASTEHTSLDQSPTASFTFTGESNDFSTGDLELNHHHGIPQETFITLIEEPILTPNNIQVMILMLNQHYTRQMAFLFSHIIQVAETSHVPTYTDENDLSTSRVTYDRFSWL
jgi:hypothetical protein